MRIFNLTKKTGNLTSNDFFGVDNGSTVNKIDYNALAKAIIEQYTGSSLAGSAQSVKAALDALNSKSLVNLQTIEVPSGSSRTMTIAGHGVLVFMGATSQTRGMYVASGYGSAMEIAEIRAVAEGVFSISGVTITVSNTTNWSLRVAFVRLL